MPSWTDYASFSIGLFVVLHLIAFIRPHGWVSRRLHPSFPANPDIAERNLLVPKTLALEELLKLQLPDTISTPSDRPIHVLPSPCGRIPLSPFRKLPNGKPPGRPKEILRWSLYPRSLRSCRTRNLPIYFNFQSDTFYMKDSFALESFCGGHRDFEKSGLGGDLKENIRHLGLGADCA
ncbi:hypothetical protein NA56DRAFT_744445 [Hyaloscypha hepaticicola]|uniref:Uncharacterized protein n=1 Tax=Hyaloscypha hepaticicola TaxID=2082293 RepID=A0A2J6QJ42_9HELO|nr:hypothetical protein NA56DRAFT_744445 [Hyaloscypha hepaticicola]